MKAYTLHDRWFLNRISELTFGDSVRQKVYELFTDETSPSGYAYDLFRMYLTDYQRVTPNTAETEGDRAALSAVKNLILNIRDHHVTVVKFDSLDVMCGLSGSDLYDSVSSDLYDDIFKTMSAKYGEAVVVDEFDEIVEAIKSILVSIELNYVSVETSGHNEEYLVLIEKPGVLILILI
ncbi:MAG: hypothetical protein PHN51_11955 [Candidatus Nanopelagicales bacterium]|nr:hypothetical protein [Candidatus Nanopelagicales bacterium]